MTICWNTVKRGKTPLLILSFGLTAMLVLCVVLYPLMKELMSVFEDMAQQMGDLGLAMGMDSTLFSSYIGYYGAECESLVGIGGMVFAAYLGATVISKEIKRKTGEFLFSHPVSRNKVLTEKILSSLIQIVILNAIIAVISFGASLAVESFQIEIFWLIHISLLIMQFEIFFITLGVSIVLGAGGAGVGIAVGFGLYFVDMISSLVEQVEFLKYITPFGYTHSSTIIGDESLDLLLMALGAVYSIAAVVMSYLFFKKKDLV